MFVFRWLLRAVKWLLLFFFSSTILAVVAYRFIPVPLTPLMLIRCVEQMKNGKEIKLHHDWESLENISPHLPVAVMASEDQLFLKHNGFDTEAIKKAYEHNKKKNSKLMGGSSITQQTAKNVFLWHGQNIVRKGLEAYFTVLMELFWSKQRIMEVRIISERALPNCHVLNVHSLQPHYPILCKEILSTQPVSCSDARNKSSIR